MKVRLRLRQPDNLNENVIQAKLVHASFAPLFVEIPLPLRPPPLPTAATISPGAKLLAEKDVLYMMVCS